MNWVKKKKLPVIEVFNNVINKCSSLSTLGSDYISWNYLKEIVGNAKYITNIINIVNSCINLSYWPLYFENLSFIIILKFNKSLYHT